MTSRYVSSVNSDPTYMQIVTSDKHEFFIKKEYGLAAKKFIELTGSEANQENKVDVEKDSLTIQHCCRYLAYKALYKNDIVSLIPHFTIDPRMLVTLFAAAQYLDC
ncbi:hypothetical protein TNCT_482541 [Trichonephila clavata]|uniref:Elongin-C n=1 Tax=Trichonephila clavata TaxID=2740835 RepID=A0A8X6LQR7_TRICU|nr:hypothetical protein TNCT_482541 [Trichonephila clavata]